MKWKTLVDLFYEILDKSGEFVIYNNGFRSWSYTYREIKDASFSFALKLQRINIKKGDRVIIWSENRPEWVVAFWGCILIGAVVVPIDSKSSFEFLSRIQNTVKPSLILIGEEIPNINISGETPIWHLTEIIKIPANNDSVSKEELKTSELEPITPDDTVEIVFTSGATAEPKGVIIKHRNIIANLIPIEQEIEKLKRYIRLFLPFRILCLPPLSHMFGQAMAVFIIPMLSSTTVFTNIYNPQEITKLIKKHKISFAVCVPKILDVLRQYLTKIKPSLYKTQERKQNFLLRWLRHIRVHRIFGLRFFGFIVGAAPLERRLEEFWSNLGFLVIQGYGLTEAAPIVSFNHPLNTRRGSVGKVLPTTEIKIAPNGEILVRGENVTPGYYQVNQADKTFEGGWLHTGDIGTLDEEGNLYIVGRKKEVIVTAEGLNVFPEDVECVLNEIPGVRESAVVGISDNGQEHVYAVIVPEYDSEGKPLIEPDEVMRIANKRLLNHQKIRGITIWPGPRLPRTEGTQKLKRLEIKEWLEKGKTTQTGFRDYSIESILAKYTGNHTPRPDTTLDELGLSSLERVELLIELEKRFNTSIDESTFASARTLNELRSVVERSLAEPIIEEHQEFPTWNQLWLFRAIRNLSLITWLLPICRMFLWIHVEGKNQLSSIRGPVIFAANHQSIMDVPAILSSLPARWRFAVATAMIKEHFSAHFFPSRYPWYKWFANSLEYYLVTVFLNTFPISQREFETRKTLKFIGELTEKKVSILIFPEGERTESGEIKAFRPGVGMIASSLKIPIVPIYLEGIHRVLHRRWWFPRPGYVRVVFGSPIYPTAKNPAAIAREVEEAVKRLGKHLREK
ncbi:MAG: AMP-binding protein [Deltaproteobacteria bacterium]|nr:MAG: AMP-binding protein [Deltaproteobacteria bacterium]